MSLTLDFVRNMVFQRLSGGFLARRLGRRLSLHPRSSFLLDLRLRVHNFMLDFRRHLLSRRSGFHLDLWQHARCSFLLDLRPRALFGSKSRPKKNILGHSQQGFSEASLREFQGAQARQGQEEVQEAQRELRRRGEPPLAVSGSLSGILQQGAVRGQRMHS